MVLTGVISAFFAAILQSSCYLVAGLYAKRSNLPGWTLTFPQQIAMLPLAIVLAAVFYPYASAPQWCSLLPYLALCTIAGLSGNFGLFQMQKYVEPSRTAPLQAFKIPLIVLFSFFFYSQSYSVQQLTGVFVIMVASKLVSGAGERMSTAAWGWLIFCSSGFALSDVAIGRMLQINSTVAGSVFQNAMFTLGIALVFSGVAAIPLFFVQAARPSLVPRFSVLAKYAFGYSALWIVALAALFYAFASSSVELGTIVQSSRSLISVVIGYVLAKYGFLKDVEYKVSPRVFLVRLFAALLIIFAIYLNS